MDPPHDRADQTLDMSAEVRSRHRPIVELDLVFPASAAQRRTAEIPPVVSPQDFGQTTEGPVKMLQVPCRQPGTLGQASLPQAQANGRHRRRLQGNVEPQDAARTYVNRHGQPRSPDGLAVSLIDDDDVGQCVIDLHAVQRPLHMKMSWRGIMFASRRACPQSRTSTSPRIKLVDPRSNGVARHGLPVSFQAALMDNTDDLFD